MRILIIEDDPTIAANLYDFLEARGHSVVVVGEANHTGRPARVLGWFGVADEVRPHAHAALRGLRAAFAPIDAELIAVASEAAVVGASPTATLM